jgi:Holliday junction resolvase RusA-like endonuclease
MNFVLPKPPTTNSYFKITSRGKFAHMYISAEGKAWQEASKEIIKKTNKRKKPIEVPSEIYIKVYTSSSRDCDASTKPVMDIFETTGVIKNDKLFEAVLAYRFKCKKGEDRVEVEIIELD